MMSKLGEIEEINHSCRTNPIPRFSITKWKRNGLVCTSQIIVAYIECSIASKAVEAGRKSFTATSLFSFFLSNSFMKDNYKNIFIYMLH